MIANTNTNINTTNFANTFHPAPRHPRAPGLALPLLPASGQEQHHGRNDHHDPAGLGE